LFIASQYPQLRFHRFQNIKYPPWNQSLVRGRFMTWGPLLVVSCILYCLLPPFQHWKTIETIINIENHHDPTFSCWKPLVIVWWSNMIKPLKTTMRIPAWGLVSQGPLCVYDLHLSQVLRSETSLWASDVIFLDFTPQMGYFVK
jgi:hypothetical protein